MAPISCPVKVLVLGLVSYRSDLELNVTRSIPQISFLWMGEVEKFVFRPHIVIVQLDCSV